MCCVTRLAILRARARESKRKAECRARNAKWRARQAERRAHQAERPQCQVTRLATRTLGELEARKARIVAIRRRLRSQEGSQGRECRAILRARARKFRESCKHKAECRARNAKWRARQAERRAHQAEERTLHYEWQDIILANWLLMRPLWPLRPLQ